MARLWILLVIVSVVQAIALKLDDDASIRDAAATVAYGLMKYYTGNQTGNGANLGLMPYPPYFWWESGAVWGGMIEYWHYTNDTSYNNVTSQALVSQISPTNDFMPVKQQFDEGNDDQAFWGLSAMSAAEYGFPNPPSAPSWLSLAKAVFDDMAGRWDLTSCNGGLKWQIFKSNLGYNYKNAIANGGLFQLAARLARHTGNQSYVDWAEKSWNWSRSIGLVDARYNVYDGTDDTKNCSKVDHGQWSYNLGMFLYGSAMLQNFTNGSTLWTTRTTGLLEAAATFFSPFPNSTDIMFEAECEKGLICNADQQSFKAYLARWLTGTGILAPYTQGAIAKLISPSALGAAASCSGGADNQTCGSKWYVNGWDGTSGVGQQLAAMEIFQCLLVNNTNPPMVAGNVHIRSAPAQSPIAPLEVTPTARPLFDQPNIGGKTSSDFNELIISMTTLSVLLAYLSII